MVSFEADGWEFAAVTKFLLLVELAVVTTMLGECEWNLDCTVVCLDTAAIVYGKHHLAPVFQEKKILYFTSEYGLIYEVYH